MRSLPRRKNWNGSHPAPADLGDGERQHESRARTVQGADERERLPVRDRVRRRACSWDHSLGWTPRPKTKVGGEKFCVAELFFWNVHILDGKGWLELGWGPG